MQYLFEVVDFLFNFTVRYLLSSLLSIHIMFCTLTGKSIPDANKPGIKIDLKKNHKALATLKNQFKPYNGIFGADLRHKGHGVTYDGTLFRFPLRNEEQARKSEISGLHYDREQV